MIATITRTKEILNKYNLLAKKKYGQNFLIDKNIATKIISIAEIDENTGVIEIGPGIGGMTEIIAEKAGKVLCYEIDEDMIRVLNEELPNEKIKIIQGDFLKCDFENDVSYFSGLNKIIVVSNLPYYITTPIIFKIIHSSVDINAMYFMVQKEVAYRLCSKPGSKDYGSLTVMIKYKCETKLEFEVMRNSFYPVPNVDSAIVSFKKNNYNYEVVNEEAFLNFVQYIFEMKRKTLVNNIANKMNINKSDLENTLTELGFSSKCRAESLKVEEIIKLFNALNKTKI